MNILCSNPLAQFKSKQKIIENTVIFYVEEGISSDKEAQKELDQAWDRVKELVRKGMIAEKYMKEWGKE